MTFSRWSIKRDTFPFFVGWPALANDVWGKKRPQLRIKVIKRQFKTIIGSVIPQLICLQACVRWHVQSFSRGGKNTRDTHACGWLWGSFFIYLYTCSTCRAEREGGEKKKEKIDGVALCPPRAVQVPADPLSLLCSKKGNYNVNVSQQGSEPSTHDVKGWWREQSHRGLTAKWRLGSVSYQTPHREE